MSSLLNTEFLNHRLTGIMLTAACSSTLLTVSISFASTDSCWYRLLNAVITKINLFFLFYRNAVLNIGIENILMLNGAVLN